MKQEPFKDQRAKVVKMVIGINKIHLLMEKTGMKKKKRDQDEIDNDDNN